MTALEIVFIVSAGAFVAGAVVLAHELRTARAQAAYWRRASRLNQAALVDALNAHHEYRMNSHRRDPKTGRLLPKGE